MNNPHSCEMTAPSNSGKLAWTRWIFLLAAMLLSACGGGGGSEPDSRMISAVQQNETAQGSASSTRASLQVEPPQAVDVHVAQFRDVDLLALGGLPDGGYAVAWRTTDDDTGRAWSLWVQRYDASGARSGDPQLLLTSSAAPAIQGFTLSALVRRDGSVVVAYVTERDLDPQARQKLYEVRARHLGLDGTPLNQEHVIESLIAERPPQSNFYGRILSTTQMAQWDDGRYLVAWEVILGRPHGGDHPEFDVRRVDASGVPVTPVFNLGLRENRPLILTTLDEGGWLATTMSRVTPSGERFYANIQQFETKHPLDLPDLKTLPWSSFVLDLRHEGAVLFSGDFGPSVDQVASPYSQWYNPAGKPAGQPAPFPSLPVFAVALDDGTYVAFFGTLAQRFDKHGRELGASVSAGGSLGAKLKDDGAVLAWTQRTSATEVRVMTQRLLTVQ